MPRLLSPSASLALPFVARDPGEPDGGAAPELDSFGFGEAEPEEGNVFEEAPEADAPPEQAPEEEKPEDAAPALPEKVDVDGAEVPLGDLQEAYRHREGNAALVELGTTYQGAMARFGEGPEGAREVIEAMVSAARESYGAEALAGIGVPPALPEDFDPEAATPNERALMAQLAAATKKMGEMQTAYGRALDELKGAASANSLDKAGEAHAATVNAKVPGAKVSGPEIVAMMKAEGLDDPVKAYKLATYEKKAVDAAPERPVDTMPRQGAAKTFDPMDKSLTADKIASLMRQGYTPATS